MQFIEMTGSDLYRVISPEELHPDELRGAGVTENSLVRVNLQGDIEIRNAHGWDVVGGLLGDFADRVKQQTGRDWA
ncbi:MAG: hypothetical protein R3C10_27050 [Pirellulales bacterium]